MKIVGYKGTPVTWKRVWLHNCKDEARPRNPPVCRILSQGMKCPESFPLHQGAGRINAFLGNDIFRWWLMWLGSIGNLISLSVSRTEAEPDSLTSHYLVLEDPETLLSA